MSRPGRPGRPRRPGGHGRRGVLHPAALRVIADLPTDQAEAVALRVLAGLEVNWVAAITGKRPGTVRVLTHRGLRRLAERLGADARLRRWCNAMGTDDASAEMPRPILDPSADLLALDEETERRLAGDLLPAEAPPGYAKVAALLAAAAAEPTPEELAGRAAALAELRP